MNESDKAYISDSQSGQRLIIGGKSLDHTSGEALKGLLKLACQTGSTENWGVSEDLACLKGLVRRKLIAKRLGRTSH